MAEEASDIKRIDKRIDRDVDAQKNCCRFFMSNSDKNLNNSSVGNLDLERVLGCLPEHLEFHLWYLKEKKG